MMNFYDKEFSILVKNSYVKLLYEGVDEKRITQMLVDLFFADGNKSEKVSEFWLALASVQYYYGRLEKRVLNEALCCIKNELLVMDTNLEYGEKYQEIIRLKQKLATPPSKKALMKGRRFCCQWKIGDVFAYPLQNEESKLKELDGKYFLFHKVDESSWYPDHIIPIVRVKICDGIPKTKEDIDKLEYIQTSFTKYEDRFLPINGAIPISEQIREKDKIDYKRDEFGQLPEYRIAIIATSSKMIPQNLIYIGNFKDLNPPKNEFVPHTKLSISSAYWKDIESRLVNKYFYYNKRSKTGD